MLAVLTEQMPRLRAEELLETASVALLPHLKSSDRRRFLRRLDRTAQREKPPREPIEVLENVVPTPVGVNRTARSTGPAPTSCPHARGGEPSASFAVASVPVLSPRPWG